MLNQTVLIGIFKQLILQKMLMLLLKYSSVMSSENWPYVFACWTEKKS